MTSKEEKLFTVKADDLLKQKYADILEAVLNSQTQLFLLSLHEAVHKEVKRRGYIHE